MNRIARTHMSSSMYFPGMGTAPFFKVKNSHTQILCLSYTERRISCLSPCLCVCVQLTVFEQEHFQGKCMEFTSECCNIHDCGMDNIRSIRVESGA